MGLGSLQHMLGHQRSREGGTDASTGLSAQGSPFPPPGQGGCNEPPHCTVIRFSSQWENRNPLASKVLVFLLLSRCSRELKKKKKKKQPQALLCSVHRSQIGEYTWMNYFERVRMQLFHFPSNSELLMFRNKLLPVLLIYKDKM